MQLLWALRFRRRVDLVGKNVVGLEPWRWRDPGGTTAVPAIRLFGGSAWLGPFPTLAMPNDPSAPAAAPARASPREKYQHAVNVCGACLSF